MANVAMGSHTKMHHIQAGMSGFALWVACIAAVAGILFGFDTGIISGAILFIAPDFHLTALQNGIVVAITPGGALFGALFGGRFADIFGRRRLLLVTALIFMVATLASALAHNLALLIVSRFFVGVAIGISSFAAPLYISEISPPRFRGVLVALFQLAVTLGIVLSYAVDFGFAKHESWRWMLGSGVFPAVLLFIGVLFLPESPRWLVYRGFMEQAKAVLSKIRHGKDVSTELEDIRISLSQQQGDWRMLFQSWVRPALIIVLGLAMAQQFTGINTIIYYAPTIFKFAGFHSATTQIAATFGVGVVNVVFTIVSLFLIDSWGRRPLLLVGLIGMFLSLAIVGYSFGHQDMAASGWLGWVTLGGLVLYIACFAASLGPIAWLVFAEMFPLRIRGLGTSLASASNWTCNMLVSLTFLPMLTSIGPSHTFYLYAGICVISFWFIYRYVPETKNVSLEQIEVNLHDGVPMRDLGKEF